MTARKIITSHINPPIPFRGSDWVATFGDYDGAESSRPDPVGFGETEAAAVEDLRAREIAEK